MTREAKPGRRTFRWRLPVSALVLAFAAGGVHADPSEAAAEQGDDDQQAAPAAATSLDERLDALLAETLSADEYRETRRCLRRNAYRHVEVLNDEYLLFSKGNDYWVNKLGRQCPILRYNDLPVFVQKGTNSVCERDPFYPSNSMDLNMGLSGGRAMGAQGICYLGLFQQITAEQAVLLRDG